MLLCFTHLDSLGRDYASLSQLKLWLYSLDRSCCPIRIDIWCGGGQGPVGDSKPVAGWDGLLDQAQSTAAAALPPQEQVPSTWQSTLWLKDFSWNLSVHVIQPSSPELSHPRSQRPLLNLDMNMNMNTWSRPLCHLPLPCGIYISSWSACCCRHSDATWSRLRKPSDHDDRSGACKVFCSFCFSFG